MLTYRELIEKILENPDILDNPAEITLYKREIQGWVIMEKQTAQVTSFCSYDGVCTEESNLYKRYWG